METVTIPVTELFAALEKTWKELGELAKAAPAKDINKVPFTDSWTVGQLITHVTKSNRAIRQGLEMPGKLAERNPESGISKLKKMFLDFETKYQSPDFIVPEDTVYEKDAVIGVLEKSIDTIRNSDAIRHLNEIISLPIFGEISKVELFHFVLYHTQRHVHQLKNILAAMHQ
jgi:hypothetical protein